MKKFIFLIFPLLILFICPFHVSAEAVPELAQSTFELIQGGIDGLNNSGLSSYGVFPSAGTSSSEIVNSYVGFDLGFTTDSYRIRPLSDVEKEDIENGFVRHFYNEDGEEISLDNLWYVDASNGYYNASFYIDSQGRVLYSDPDSQHVLLTLGLDDKGFQNITGTAPENWNSLYFELANRIANNNYNYSPTGEDLTANTYFVFCGETYHGSPAKAGYVLISNQYQPRVIVPIQTIGAIHDWYTNDLTLIQYCSTLGDISDWLQVSSGDFIDKNIHYRYHVTFTRGQFATSNTATQTYQQWLVSPIGTDWFGISGTDISQVKASEGKSLIRTNTPEVPYISPDEMYNYDDLILVNPSSTPEINPYYDPSYPIDPDNYPNQYPVPNIIINPSVSPLPGVSDLINPSPAPADNPIVSIDPNAPFGTTVPLLNNLFRRFPFSIPWDIYRVVNRLVFTPRPPAWDFNYSITVWGTTYTTHFQGDLSAFNSLAEIFRTLQLVAFVFFLCFFSYKHFF